MTPKRKRMSEQDLRMELLKQDLEKGKLEIKLLEKQITNYELQNKSLEIDIEKKCKSKRRKTDVMENEKAQTNIIQQAMIQNDILLSTENQPMSCYQDQENPLVWHISFEN